MNFALVFIALAATWLTILEIRKIRNDRRQILRENAWPQFEETYISALQSGISISDAFSFANDFELPELGAPVRSIVNELDRGLPLAKALEGFQKNLNLIYTDLFVAIVAIAHKSGSQNLIPALTEHASAVRFELASLGDVRARQNAILAVAKLGLLAPWVLVAVLSVNEQTRKAFGTLPGNLILIAGFVVSLIAYRLIVSAGRITKFKRIFVGYHGS
jgi:tight adherence protein B